MKKTIKKYLKRREKSKKIGGFTFVEIVLIIAILGVITVMVIYGIKPVEVYRKAFNLQTKADIKSIGDGVKTFALRNRGKYPIGFTGLPEGTYDICKSGYSGCTSNSVNLDDLVAEGILSKIPVSPYNLDNTTTYTGYQINYNPLIKQVNVIEADLVNPPGSTPTTTPSLTPTPTPYVPSNMTLTSMCNDLSTGKHKFRVRNTNPDPIDYSFTLYGTSETGNGNAPQGDTYFYVTTSQPGTTVINYSLNGVNKSTVKAQNTSPCS